MTDIADNENKIRDLKQKRLWFVILFLIFILIPLLISPFLLVEFEPDLDYNRAFLYTVQEVTGINTNSTIVLRTPQSVGLVAVLGILKFVFIGFGAAIFATELDILMLKRKRHKAPDVHKKGT